MAERWRTELRRIDRLAPDHDVVERAMARPRRPDPSPSPVAKIVTIVVALALPIAGMAAAFIAFRGGESRPSAAGNSESPPIKNGDLLYTKNVNNGWSLFALDPDTGLERHITEGFRDYGSDWSPDGTRIVYDSELSPGGQEGQGIWVANADGSDPRQLIENGSVPAWSPDGTRIAFARPDFDQMVSYGEGMSGTSTHLYVMNADGTNVQRLTDGPVADYSPAWSPDGSQIAFIRYGRDVRGVFVMNADGSGVRQVQAHLQVLSAPDWAPDGSAIAVAINGTKDGSSGGIWVVPADGSGRGIIIPGSEVEYPDHLSNPAWSPDGEWIAYVHGYRGEIVIIRPDGSGRRTLDVDPGNDSIEELAWGVRSPQAPPSRPVAAPSISPSPTPRAEFEVARGTHLGDPWRVLLSDSRHGWCLAVRTGAQRRSEACGFGVPPRDLGVTVTSGADLPTLVMGVVSARVHAIQVRLTTGRTIDVEILPPPAGAGVQFRVFYAALDERVLAGSHKAGRVEATDSKGNVVATYPLLGPPPHGPQETPPPEPPD